MTKKEALISIINFTLPDSRIEKALIDAELDGTSVYAKTDEKSIDLCFLGLLFTLITSADISEDDVSLKIPQRDVLLKLYSALCKKLGISDPFETTVPQPKVKMIGFW